MGGVSSTKRVATDVASPLDDPGFLLHVLDILGPGHHLFHLSCEQNLERKLRESWQRADSWEHIRSCSV
jgi:hypothetical protein